jgi:hypothetical protein
MSFDGNDKTAPPEGGPGKPAAISGDKSAAEWKAQNDLTRSGCFSGMHHHGTNRHFWQIDFGLYRGEAGEI